ncbi:MAG TPA: hypothetical protein VJK29_23060 [Terriglobales bacterium]|nr:hypothetical protein [Terriglobales bacterium]
MQWIAKETYQGVRNGTFQVNLDGAINGPIEQEGPDDGIQRKDL